MEVGKLRVFMSYGGQLRGDGIGIAFTKLVNLDMSKHCNVLPSNLAEYLIIEGHEFFPTDAKDGFPIQYAGGFALEQLTHPEDLAVNVIDRLSFLREWNPDPTETSAAGFLG